MKNGDTSVVKISMVDRESRQRQFGHKSTILWFTGLSGSGKSTLANAVEVELHNLGCRTYVLDGDNVRKGLCSDLGFSPSDRAENIRRAGEVANLLLDAGSIVLAAFISPYRVDRDRVRKMVRPDDFVEIYCECDLGTCETRDVKGLYRLARAGKIREFTGVSSPYEVSISPELCVNTASSPLDKCVEQIISYMRIRSLLPSGVREPFMGRVD